MSDAKDQFDYEVKTIEEWQEDIEKSYIAQGYKLDGSEKIQDFLSIPDKMYAEMDGRDRLDAQTLDRLIALYNVERKRFRSMQPGIFGAYLLMFGALSVDELAGILGAAIDRASKVIQIDPLEGLLNEDDT